MTDHISSLVSLFIIVLLLAACGSTAPSPGSARLPQTKQQVPQYETDNDLKKKIKRLTAALSKSPEDTKLLLQLAGLHQEVKEYDQAMIYMEKLKAKGYVEDPRLYGSLAAMYVRSENFEQALENFKMFKSLLPPSSETLPKVEKEIERIEYVILLQSNPSNIDLRPFGDKINTKNSEYLPQFTMDESTFIFTRRFFDQEDLFVANKTADGYITEPMKEINSLLNEGAHTLSADGNLLIFTLCDGRNMGKVTFGSCDLFRSRKKADGSWTKPVNMGKRINTTKWDSQPSLSADGRTLYFVSDREGSLGGTDIWMSTIDDEGKWSIPTNLGPKINTTGSDESPFIHADGRTLYFRSTGYLGMGGFDLFRSQLENKVWSEPTNLGSPINTTGQDGALVVSLDGTKGYYATDNYNDQKLNHLDLFEFDLPDQYRPSPMTFVKGRVTDEITKLPIRGNIQVSYLDDSNYSTYYKANTNGEFLAAVPIGKPALLHVSADGYVFYSDHINYTDVKYSIDPYLLDVALTEIAPPITSEEESKPIVLRNLFFQTGSSFLLPNSESEIELLRTLLEEQPNVKIEIIGHTDNSGSPAPNLKLSEERAASVKNALVERGISEDRIKTSGMGETAPIDSNDTAKGRANNRRTEFVIIK